MTITSIIEESRSPSPVSEQLSPTLEKQVAEIVGAARDEIAQDHAAQLNVAEEAANTISLGYSVPMPGVRYYTYL